MGKLKNERSWEELPEIETGSEKEKKQTEERQKGGGGGGDEAGGEEETAAVLVVAEKKKRPEEKAAKIERLKSGFKICKPQGTFLWPNMMKQLPLSPSPQLDDLFVAVGGGPPSVSSSSASPPPPFPQLLLPPSNYNLHGSQSPVRPLAERRAFSVNENWGSNYTATTTTTTSTQKTTSIINLNDLPISAGDDGRQTGHTMATISPRMQLEQMVGSSSTKREIAAAEIVGGRGRGRKTIRQVGAASWLALGTPNSV